MLVFNERKETPVIIPKPLLGRLPVSRPEHSSVSNTEYLRKFIYSLIPLLKQANYF